MTDSQKIIFDNLSQKTLVHIAWEGRCNPDNLHEEYLAYKQSQLLFKFSDVYYSFYNNTSPSFAEHELSMMKYSVEKITLILMDYSKSIDIKYKDTRKISDKMFDMFAARLWNSPENQKALSIIAPDLWLPS